MSLTSYVSSQIIQTVPTRGNMRVARFTADGTWTVPAGVTYAVAHIRGGGGGCGRGSSGTGGTSSVAFASGTVSANGGVGANTAGGASSPLAFAGAANSGQGGSFNGLIAGDGGVGAVDGLNGAYIVAGADVTPAASITVTVGAGGTAGTSGAAGGSGYVWIEFLA